MDYEGRLRLLEIAQVPKDRVRTGFILGSLAGYGLGSHWVLGAGYGLGSHWVALQGTVWVHTG